MKEIEQILTKEVEKYIDKNPYKNDKTIKGLSNRLQYILDNSDEVTKYSEVANNISTTNKDLILKSLNGTLTNKGYYKYTSTKPCEYTINNKKTLVYVTPREVVSNENSYTNATYE